jgi:hypothetical protein
MRVAGVIAGTMVVSACSLITGLDDLRKDGGGDAGSSTIAYVQGRTVHDSGAKTSTWSTSVSIPNVTAHDAIVVGAIVVQSGPPLNTITVTDDRGDTFVIAGPITSYDGWVNSVVWTAFDVAGSNTIVTINAAGSAIEASDVFVVEYSGISANDAISTGTGHTTGADGIVATPVKLNGSSDLLVGLAYTDGAASVGASFTSRFTGGNDSSLFEDRITTSSGTYGATATMSASGNYWVMVMAAFK